MENYVYKPLSYPHAIRVLIVEPAETMDAPLRCCLKELVVDWRELEMGMVYDALSYVWGAAAGDRPLLCDGRTLLVTPNCESALRHLREKQEQLVIWVDAVCINQEDISERNFQVAIMRFIYNRAQRVYIWLGKGGEDAAEMFRTINSVGRWRRLLPDSALRLFVPQLGTLLPTIRPMDRVDNF